MPTLRAARDVAGRIRELCEQLRYPYNIFYMTLPELDEVRILRIRHGARRPEPLSDDDQKV